MGWMWLWVALLVIGLTAVVVGLYGAVRAGARSSRPNAPAPEGARAAASDPADRRRPSALQILDERFARGEIDEAEYQTRRRLLDGR